MKSSREIIDRFLSDTRTADIKAGCCSPLNYLFRLNSFMTFLRERVVRTVSWRREGFTEHNGDVMETAGRSLQRFP